MPVCALSCVLYRSRNPNLLFQHTNTTKVAGVKNMWIHCWYWTKHCQVCDPNRESVWEFWAGWWNCHLPCCVSTIYINILMPCECKHLVFCDIWLSIQPVKITLHRWGRQNSKNDKPFSNNLYNFSFIAILEFPK